MTDRQAVRPALAADDWDRLTEEPLPELDGEYPLSEAQIEGFWENGFIVLEGVLDRAEITAYGEAIRDVAMAHFRARGLALSFGGAFLQQLNLRYCSDAVRNFVQSPRFGRIASRLLRAPAVRLYHEQALFKPPGGTDSHWHQDQFYFPFDDTFTMGLWMPLVDCSLDMGPLRFVAGSHKYGNLEGMSISEVGRRARLQHGARVPAVHGVGGGPGGPQRAPGDVPAAGRRGRHLDDADPVRRPPLRRPRPLPGAPGRAQAGGAQQPLDTEPRLRHRRRPGALATSAARSVRQRPCGTEECERSCGRSPQAGIGAGAKMPMASDAAHTRACNCARVPWTVVLTAVIKLDVDIHWHDMICCPARPSYSPLQANDCDHRSRWRRLWGADAR